MISSVDGLSEFCFLVTSPAFENSRSLATDVAGMHRVCATAATDGNWVICFAHQANGDDVLSITGSLR